MHISKYKSHVNCKAEQPRSPTMSLTIVTEDVVEIKERIQPTKWQLYESQVNE